MSLNIGDRKLYIISLLKFYIKTSLKIVDQQLIYNFELVSAVSTAPLASISLISSTLYPSSAIISCVCWPTSGLGLDLDIPGVRDRRGAGAGSQLPWWLGKNDWLALLCGWLGASSRVSTGVTQASFPSKTLHHWAWVFDAKILANIFFMAGHSLWSICDGSSSGESCKPDWKIQHDIKHK